MRQATQSGLDFAISPDETPHQRQCIHVLRGFRDESTPRRCLGLRIPRGSYCRAHAPCCRELEETGHHDQECPDFFHMIDEL